MVEDQDIEMLNDRVNALQGDLENTVKEFEKRLEIADKTLANLMIGYAEAVVMIEALVSSVLYDSEPQKKEMFDKIVAERRQQMLTMIQDAPTDTPE